MGQEEDNGLTLQGLAQRLETLERENERMCSENAELRDEVSALRGSGTRRGELAERRGSDTRRSGESASEFEGRVSRKSLLSKAGAAAVAAVAAGTLLNPRQARANHYGPGIEVDFVNAHNESGYAVKAEAPSTSAVRAVGAYGVEAYSSSVGAAAVSGGRSYTGFLNYIAGYGVVGNGAGADYAGVYGYNYRQGPGVKGEGVIGVWGKSSTEGQAGVYAEHKTTAGPGVVADANGPGYAGVLGRNSSAGFNAFGVKGETVEGVGVKGTGKVGVIGESPTLGHASVYGQHVGSSGYGVVGDGTGGSAGVLGRNTNGTGVEGRDSRYGGKFAGSRAQLMLEPASTRGKPTTGTHTKGEIYMDSAGTLFVCTAGDGSTVGTWKRVSATVV